MFRIGRGLLYAAKKAAEGIENAGCVHFHYGGATYALLASEAGQDAPGLLRGAIEIGNRKVYLYLLPNGEKHD